VVVAMCVCVGVCVWVGVGGGGGAAGVVDRRITPDEKHAVYKNGARGRRGRRTMIGNAGVTWRQMYGTGYTKYTTTVIVSVNHVTTMMLRSPPAQTSKIQRVRPLAQMRMIRSEVHESAHVGCVLLWRCCGDEKQPRMRTMQSLRSSLSPTTCTSSTTALCVVTNCC
jgi:hypothetical protein